MGADITVVPANATTEEVMRHKPHGVLLSNGPGDPAATGEYAIPTIKGVVDTGMPVFGICLGHQMLGLALGAQDQEDGAGPSRRQSSGEGPDHRQGRDRLDESRLHGGPRHPAQGRQAKPMSRCSTAPIAASRWKARTCSASSITPKRRPGRWTRTICSSVLPRPRRSGLKADEVKCALRRSRFIPVRPTVQYFDTPPENFPEF